MTDTETFALLPKSEIKTIPVICSWCRRIISMKRWNVVRGERISPDYGICPDCYRKIRIENGCTERTETTTSDGRILVVDDEGGFCGLLFDTLHPLGYSIITCNSGRDAVTCYSKLHDDIDLVLLDMKMSEMDGYETFLNMRRINPGIKVIVVTGYSRDSDIRDILAAGALCVLEKPFSPVMLVERIRAALQQAIPGRL